MFLANKLNKGGSLSSPDAQFNYVTMLLHGDGTNGAQNNTFLDSSTNNFTITRNGNTTQGSFSPYGSNWSNYFNGSSDNLTFPNNTAFAFGTGSFTIEFWINGPLNNDKFILGGRNAIGTMHITTGGSASTAGVLRYVGTSTIVSSNVITDNTWHHCAIVRNGSSNITLYVDGVSVGTGTDTTNYTTTSGTWYISRNDLGAGNYLNAYISNFRIVKGTAVYTSAFTPSTTPLTAITNTSLLTCQSNRFVDNSANAFAITLEGTPSVQRFNPFGTATAYSTSVIGGSGYFDGTGDYLNLGNQTALHLGSGSFTVEMWVYKNANTAYMVACGDLLANTTNTFQIVGDATGSKINWYDGFGGAFTLTSTASIPINAWTHIAFVRNSTTLTLYINGVSDVSTTYTRDLNATTSFFVGQTPELLSSRYWNGYISDLRVVKGSAVYTTAFTPPTAPLTAITNTQLLTNYTNGAIIDNAMMNDLETVGNAQISTSVVKYGTGSIAFDGTGDYLDSGGSAVNFAFGTGNFTIEFWMYLNSTTQGHPIDFRPSNVNGAYPTLYITSNTLIYFVNSANRITSSSLSTSTWYHIVICRSGTSTKMFINGTQDGSTYTDSTDYLCKANGPRIGASDQGTGGVNGYIDDLRITKGYARYTANFTPPTSALSDTGPV